MDLGTKIILAIIGSTGFWTVLCSAVQGAVQRKRKKKSAETRLMMGMAYDRIIEQAEACIRRGWVSPDEYKDLVRYYYEPYKELGGDGTAERLMEQVKRLPNCLPWEK